MGKGLPHRPGIVNTVPKLPKIAPLSPFLVSKIWGGQRLEKLKGLELPPRFNGPLGESWEVAILPQGSSSFRGRPLDEYIPGQDVTNKLPYVVKFIDTSDNLSFQVHPHTECWIILEAEAEIETETEAGAGAGVYLGLSPGVTKKDMEEVALGSKEDFSFLLQFHPVSPGDFFLVPPGMAHAIGKGVLLLEVQQRSGITYRIWDWNRANSQGQSRELHLDNAMQVLRFEEDFNQQTNPCKSFGQPSQTLLTHPQFEVSCHVLPAPGGMMEWHSTPKRYASLIVLKGDVALSGEKVHAYRSALISPGEEVQVRPLSHQAKCVLVQ